MSKIIDIYDTINSKNYSEIVRLHNALTVTKIPHKFLRSSKVNNGYQIVYPVKGKPKCKISSNSLSIGGLDNHLEIVGLTTKKEGKTKGNLNSAEVFERIVKDWGHGFKRNKKYAK